MLVGIRDSAGPRGQTVWRWTVWERPQLCLHPGQGQGRQHLQVSRIHSTIYSTLLLLWLLSDSIAFSPSDPNPTFHPDSAPNPNFHPDSVIRIRIPPFILIRLRIPTFILIRIPVFFTNLSVQARCQGQLTQWKIVLRNSEDESSVRY